MRAATSPVDGDVSEGHDVDLEAGDAELVLMPTDPLEAAGDVSELFHRADTDGEVDVLGGTLGHSVLDE